MNDPKQNQPPPSQPPTQQTNQNPSDQPCIDSADLFQDRQEIKIRHKGDIYRLRVTRSGKLILHK